MTALKESSMGCERSNNNLEKRYFDNLLDAARTEAQKAGGTLRNVHKVAQAVRSARKGVTCFRVLCVP
jgi:hypothetical protein